MTGPSSGRAASSALRNHRKIFTFYSRAAFDSSSPPGPPAAALLRRAGGAHLPQLARDCVLKQRPEAERATFGFSGLRIQKLLGSLPVLEPTNLLLLACALIFGLIGVLSHWPGLGAQAHRSLVFALLQIAAMASGRATPQPLGR